jgi:hypothetical protein
MADSAANVVHPASGRLGKERAFERIVFVALGVLLLMTAWLKLQGPANRALGQNTILFTPRVQFVVMEVEALLGLWLLSGRAKRAAWFFAVAFFLTVAGVSLRLGLMGQSSCGCFGRIRVSPWSAFALDVACLAGLGLCRPSFRRGQGDNTADSHRLREMFMIGGGVGAILAVCLGGVLLASGSRPGDFLARVRGDRITVEPPVTDLGPGETGQKCRFTVLLDNHTDHTIRIVGGTTSCACTVTDDLPVSIPPGGFVPVTVSTGFKGTPGLFQQEFQFYYADGEEQGRVLARFEGRVVSPRSDKSPTASKE